MCHFLNRHVVKLFEDGYKSRGIFVFRFDFDLDRRTMKGMVVPLNCADFINFMQLNIRDVRLVQSYYTNLRRCTNIVPALRHTQQIQPDTDLSIQLEDYQR